MFCPFCGHISLSTYFKPPFAAQHRQHGISAQLTHHGADVIIYRGFCVESFFSYHALIHERPDKIYVDYFSKSPLPCLPNGNPLDDSGIVASEISIGHLFLFQAIAL